MNTKNHSGKQVWVGGHTFLASGARKDHIRNAEFESGRAAKLLSKALGWPVPVRPVIAVFDPQRLTIKKTPVRVAVVEARRLVRFLKQQPVVLGPDAVAQIVSVIGEPKTWSYQPDESADLDRRREFDAVHATIRAAGRVRMVWAFAVIATMGAVTALVGPELFRLLLIAITKLLGAEA